MNEHIVFCASATKKGLTINEWRRHLGLAERDASIYVWDIHDVTSFTKEFWSSLKPVKVWHVGPAASPSQRELRVKAFELADKSQEPGLLYEFACPSALRDRRDQKVSTRNFVSFVAQAGKERNYKKWRTDYRENLWGRRRFVSWSAVDTPLDIIKARLLVHQRQLDSDKKVKKVLNSIEERNEQMIEQLRRFLEETGQRVIVSRDDTITVSRSYRHFYSAALSGTACGANVSGPKTKDLDQVDCPACKASSWYQTMKNWLQPAPD